MGMERQIQVVLHARILRTREIKAIRQAGVGWVGTCGLHEKLDDFDEVVSPRSKSATIGAACAYLMYMLPTICRFRQADPRSRFPGGSKPRGKDETIDCQLSRKKEKGEIPKMMIGTTDGIAARVFECTTSTKYTTM